ncbi:unnamed protein product [Heligmosomoides polygyrus]|uniref:Exocyst complex component Sec8 n=1 Tax=Heligmosomoides polygyrus TaxID=6339 RepID=A0A3P7YHF5_HELPZ|nr:unnamed protein product [Heligmosomoides polygyrus]
MIGDLEELERDIACGLEVIAKGLQERYVEFQPLMKVAEEDIILRLEDLSNKVNENLQIADSFLRENSSMDSSVEKSRLALSSQDRLLRKKLNELSDCRQLLDKVQNIEGLLISCRSNSLGKVNEARNLLECEMLLNEITQEDGWPILTGRVRDILRDEVCFMMKSLIDSLACSFDEFVSYPTTDVKGTVHMHIRNDDPEEVTQVVAALSLLGELDKRLKKWASYVVKNFVQPIIDSETGVDPYERITVTSNIVSEKIVIQQCVAASISVPDSDGSKLKRAMELAEQFRMDMIDLKFFNDATPTFQAFAEQHFTVFIDRRCLEIIKKAKELICMPYLELAEVGCGEEVSEETIIQYKEAFGKMMPKSSGVYDAMYPLLLQLPRCKIRPEFQKLSARLALTARNVIQLYELTAPRHHETAISSMPQMAAIFYNNCYYICHRLMLMPFSVLKSVDKQSEKYAHFRPILSDSLWKLRDIAADMLEQTIRQCRRDISVMLTKDDLFVKIDDGERCDETKNVLNACNNHVQNISRLLKDVLAEMVYSQTMANIVSFLLDSICDVILRMEDIRSVDAEITAVMVDELLAQLVPVFTINGRSAIHEVCSTSYFRTKEIIFCLKGSLQSIDDRWCSAKGPLAQWLQPNEVRSLIKALFMNTEQRRQLLDSIF